MKIITETQINAILSLLTKYNVGVKDYSAVVKLFNELPTQSNETQNNDTETEEPAK